MKLKTRPYDSSKRKAQAEARKQEIVACAAQILRDRAFGDFTLEEVAERAQTSVQTILRAYGSKDELLVTVLGSLSKPDIVDALQNSLESGQYQRVMEALFGIYEKIGDAVVRMLAEEPRLPRIKEVNDVGRDFHRGLVNDLFADHLARCTPDQRRVDYAALLAVTDIYMWQILRRDEGMSLREVTDTVIHTIGKLIKEDN